MLYAFMWHLFIYKEWKIETTGQYNTITHLEKDAIFEAGDTFFS